MHASRWGLEDHHDHSHAAYVQSGMASGDRILPEVEINACTVCEPFQNSAAPLWRSSCWYVFYVVRARILLQTARGHRHVLASAQNVPLVACSALSMVSAFLEQLVCWVSDEWTV